MKFDDNYFKNLAVLYVDAMGDADLDEASVPLEAVHKTDSLVRKGIFSRRLKKISYAFAPIAACFIIALIYFSRPLGSYDSQKYSLNNFDEAHSMAEENFDEVVDEACEEVAEDSDFEVSDSGGGEIVTKTEEQLEADLSPLNLPFGYVLTQTDYDGEKTIYYIADAQNNEIVIVADPLGETPLADSDLIWVEKDGVLYTVSGECSVEELVEILNSLM